VRGLLVPEHAPVQADDRGSPLPLGDTTFFQLSGRWS
jgi:hypothetical protein